jgi:hypothetical protein
VEHNRRDVSSNLYLRKLPDGTIILTAPTGHTYLTEAHGAAMFPTLAQSTGELSLPTLDEPSPYRAVMMPKRKQTRKQNRRDRINQERRQRTELIAEEDRQRQAWLADNYKPPPFEALVVSSYRSVSPSRSPCAYRAVRVRGSVCWSCRLGSAWHWRDGASPTRLVTSDSDDQSAPAVPLL